MGFVGKHCADARRGSAPAAAAAWMSCRRFMLCLLGPAIFPPRGLAVNCNFLSLCCRECMNGQTFAVRPARVRHRRRTAKLRRGGEDAAPVAARAVAPHLAPGG